MKDFCEIPSQPPEKGKTGIVTRIYINEEGDLIVTDLWEEIRKPLLEGGHFREDD